MIDLTEHTHFTSLLQETPNMVILELKPVMCAHTYSNMYMCVISDSPFSMKEESIKWLFGSIRTNSIHITYNDIHTDGGRAMAKTG